MSGISQANDSIAPRLAPRLIAVRTLTVRSSFTLPMISTYGSEMCDSWG